MGRPTWLLVVCVALLGGLNLAQTSTYEDTRPGRHLLQSTPGFTDAPRLGLPTSPPSEATSLPTIRAPSRAVASRALAPRANSTAPAPAPGPEEDVPTPAPAEEDNVPTPAPADENSVPAPAPGPEEEDNVPTPAPADENSVPTPAPGEEDGAPAPAPGEEDNSPAPAPSDEDSVPAPAPADAETAPAPTPDSAVTVPAPAPDEETVPSPSPELVAGVGGDESPTPAPAPEAPGSIPVPAPGPASAIAPTPAGQQSSAPGPSPSARLPVLAFSPGGAPGIAPGSTPSLAPQQPNAPGPSPSSAVLLPGLPTNPTASPGQALEPSAQPASSPTEATVPSPEPSPADLATSPELAPSPQDLAAIGDDLTPGPAEGPSESGPTPALSPDESAPATVLIYAPSSPGLSLAPSPSLSQALTPEGTLPSADLTPAQAPGPASLLRELYPATALAPAPAGELATLVTVAATGQAGGVQVIDSTTGLARSALPQDLDSGSTLYATAGDLDVIVQTSSPQTDLPVNALSVEGASVRNVTAVDGSNDQLFDVGLTTNPGADTVTISTIAGVALTSGLTSLASNQLQINLAEANPQVTITSGSRYASGETVTPSFTIDFGGRVSSNDPSGLYELSGAERSDVVYDIQNGRIFLTVYIINATEQARNITVNVPAGVTTDLTGTPNSAAVYTYEYTPANPKITTVSNTMNGVVGAGMAVAVIGPLAVGSVASGATSATAAAIGSFSLINLVRGLQFTYLAGQMNVQNMPPNFQQLANSFQWSVLNFRAPWQHASSNTVSERSATSGFSTTPEGVTSSPAGRRLLQVSTALAPVAASNGTISLPAVTGGESQYVVTSTGLNQTEGSSAPDLVESVTSAALGESDDPYDTLWRAIFWTGIGLIAITVGAIALSAFFAYKNWDIPVILQSPRPQIMLLVVAVPAVAQACAGLFAEGGGKDIAVGVVICVVFPAVMLIFSAWFVARNIFRNNRRRAAWVLNGDPELEEKEKRSLWSRILDYVVGPQGKEGTWMALKQRDSRFVNQYGPLFEMNLGPPMLLTGVTYEKDPKTGYCERGQLVPVYEKPVLKLGKLVVYPHHLQAQNGTYEVAQGIATAIILKSFTAPNSYPQVIILIVLNVLMLLWLRLIRPVGDRTGLIMSMIGTLSTLGTYICGLILLAHKDGSSEFRNRIGIAMIVLSLWSVVTIILGWIAYLVTAYGLWIEFFHWAFPSTDKARTFAKVVEQVMAKDEYILSRKFADRWMRKALGVGLYKRTLLRKERANRGERLREVAFLAALQKGRVLRAGKRPYTQQSPAVAAWPDMPALAKLKSKKEEEPRQDGWKNGRRSDDSPNEDIMSSQDDLVPGHGNTSSQPTTPMPMEMRELMTDPEWEAKHGKQKANSRSGISPLAARGNSPQRVQWDEVRPRASHLVLDMEEAPPQRPRSPTRRPRSPGRQTAEQSRRARANWNRRFESDDKENR